MDEKIFKLYLDKIKEEYSFINIVKQSSKLHQIMIIIYFLLAAIFSIMIIIGCFKNELFTYACIPLFLLIIPASTIIISSKKDRTVSIQIKNLTEEIKIVNEILKQFNINNNDEIEKLYNRLNII